MLKPAARNLQLRSGHRPPRWAESQFEKWLEVCPVLTLDNRKPTIRQLMSRISLFWLPDESNLYVGKATSLRDRVSAYYRTRIGAPKPHSGGYFLKLLADLDRNIRSLECRK